METVRASTHSLLRLKLHNCCFFNTVRTVKWVDDVSKIVTGDAGKCPSSILKSVCNKRVNFIDEL